MAKEQPVPKKPSTMSITPIDSVVVEDSITVRDLAKLMERSPIDLIKVLMQYGIMAPITHSIDHDTAVILGEELGIAVKWPATENVDEAPAEVVPEKPLARHRALSSVYAGRKRMSRW